jgi:protein O-mannosyl-transferase
MQRQSLLVALLIGVTAAAFWQVYQLDFVWDDSVNLVNNPYMAKDFWPGLARFWLKPFAYLYVPLTYTVWLLIARFGTLWSLLIGSSAQVTAAPYHLVNLLFHLAAVIVVFAILKKLTHRDWPAAAGALLFAVHPVQVEAVAWVTGLKDVLGGLLSLVAVWQYLSYAEGAAVAHKPADYAKERVNLEADSILTAKARRRHYALASVAFGLAILAKPTAAALPLALWVLDCVLVGRSMRQATGSLAGWLVAGLLTAWVTIIAQTEELIDYFTPLWARPLLLADAIGFYAYKLIYPLRLGIDYGRSAQWVVKEGWLDFFWMVPFVIAMLIWRSKGQRPRMLAAAAIFVVGILPVSGLFLFVFQKISIVADRYLYFSMLGPALVVASILSERRGKPAAMVTAAVLGLLAVKTSMQVQVWRDKGTLFASALAINPKSWIARNNYAYDLLDHGKIDEALAQLQEVLQQKPELIDSIVSVGIILAQQGKLDEAMARYEEALRIHPSSPISALAHNGMADVLSERGQVDDAIHHYREAVRIDPEYFDAQQKLGNLLFERGQMDEAIPHLEQGLKGIMIRPDAYNNLAIALAKTGRIDEAIGLLRVALRTDPNDAGTRNNLGIILAGTGEVEGGVEQFREAVRLQPDFAQAHENLSRALGLLGKLDEASRHHQEAQRIEAAQKSATPGR